MRRQYHGSGVSRTGVALVALTCLFAFVDAQIYGFEEGVALPEKKTLHTMYAFYIYSYKDAPERSLGQPFVKFHGLTSVSTSKTVRDADMADYQGVQLSILPYNDFWNLIQPAKFCSTAEDVQAGRAKMVDQLLVQKPVTMANEEVNMYTHTVRFQNAEKDTQRPVRTTGVYILVYSNCGDFEDAKVVGSVVVKNAYGFLPGNEYHKMPFYGWMALVYASMALVWMGLSIRWWRELFHIQYCVAVVIFLGLVEAFLSWMFFNDWNNSGNRGRFLFVMVILVSVVKTVFSYMLVLVASLGWGVTRPYLDHRTIMKVQAVSVLYIVLDFIRESVLSFRHSHSLSLAFVLLCLLPVALLNGVIFYWIFTALSSLIETLRSRRQQEKLLLFERLWKILVAALAMQSCTMLFQIFDLSRSINIRWHYQWFFVEGVSHILFSLVLMSMMYLWAPHTNSQRYVYSHQVDGNDDAETGGSVKPNVWADEGLEDEGDDDSFWATTHGAAKSGNVAAPDKIGAKADDDLS